MASSSPTLYLTVGLPGTGKTTWARRTAAEQRILRLTPDEWMNPLFGASDVDGRRDVLEGRMIWTAHQVLCSGASVILDFGCWSPEERWAIRDTAQRARARFELVSFELTEAERRRRASRRFAEAPHTTFEMTDADHDRYLKQIQLPTADEFAGKPMPSPPAPHQNWPGWAAERWPSLPVLE